MNLRRNSKARTFAEGYRSQIELMVSMKLSLDKMAGKMKELNLTTSTVKFYTAGSVSNLCKYLEIER